MFKRILLITFISVISLSLYGISAFSEYETEYKVTVLPNSEKYSDHRTDGWFFYSKKYPDGYAVYAGTGASVYNIKGESVLPQGDDYYFVDDNSVFSDGLLCMKKYLGREEGDGFTYLNNPKYGYFDDLSNVAIDFIYEDAKDFSCGLGVVKKDEKYGCIDRYGNTVIDFLYNEMYQLI